MRAVLAVAVGLVLTAGLWALWRLWPAPTLPLAEYEAIQTLPLTPLQAPPAVYFLGHSLIGRDMPSMLQAATGGQWAAQLGWGASLRDHLRGEVAGFDTENAHPHFRPADQALASGDYPVVVVTEMVELKDALRYHDSARSLAEWVRRARAGNPDVRVYLFETWHRTDDPSGWDNRITTDGPALWRDALLRPAMAQNGVGRVLVIPGGAVMQAASRAAEQGQIPGVPGRAALFSDEIHLSGLGQWLMAMTHYAVIMGRSPEGLPARLPLAGGGEAGAPSAAAAAALQALVWKTVTAYPASGVKG